MIIILLLIGLAVGFVIRNAKKQERQRREYMAKYMNSTQPPTIPATPAKTLSEQQPQPLRMESIIDVGVTPEKIARTSSTSGKVPYWAHRYVYSNNELQNASAQQKQFYQFFKERFKVGHFLDLEGNSNYAFILLFDLLEEYEKTRNADEAERLMQALTTHYPITSSYGFDFLMRKMKELGDVAVLQRLSGDHFSWSYSGTNYATFQWRKKIRSSLNLSQEDAKILEKITDYGENTFSSHAPCSEAIVSLFIAVVNELNAYFKRTEKSIEETFISVADTVARKEFRYRTGSANYKYAVENLTEQFYQTIYRICENTVREHYGHKRKVSVDEIRNEEARMAFDTLIGQPLASALEASKHKIPVPSEITERYLNKYNTTRWKARFAAITDHYDKTTFASLIYDLASANEDNPMIESIFYEASKFVAKSDPQLSLEFYLDYLHYDLISSKFDNKGFSKSIQKSLFKTQEQQDTFMQIVNDLIADKNLSEAKEKVRDLYAVKRKKIKLNHVNIQEVVNQHSETVGLLNEILKDDEADTTTASAEIRVQVPVNTISSAYAKELMLAPVHIATLDFFAKNSLSVSRDDLDAFVREQGAFLNQLMDSINEKCFDLIDDVLIEEDSDYYNISETYYQTILS